MNRSKYFGLNIALLVISAVLLVLGFVVRANHQKKLAAYTHTTAVVSRITSDSDDSDEDSSSGNKYVYISYEADGKQISDVRLQGAGSSAQVGDEVEIAYNPDDPTDFVAAGSSFGAAVLWLGAFATLASVGFLYGIEWMWNYIPKELRDPVLER